MLRFAKPDGSTFGQDYEGIIHVFDFGNDIIAICHGKEEIEVHEEECDEIGCDCDTDFIVTMGDPYCWDDWQILISCANEEEEGQLMRAIATAYNACMLAETLSNREVLNGEE